MQVGGREGGESPSLIIIIIKVSESMYGKCLWGGSMHCLQGGRITMQICTPAEGGKEAESGARWTVVKLHWLT